MCSCLTQIEEMLYKNRVKIPTLAPNSPPPVVPVPNVVDDEAVGCPNNPPPVVELEAGCPNRPPAAGWAVLPNEKPVCWVAC